jgi:16S rRNA (guanine(966)-N(2))-methyltransferase RsmD
MRVIAGQYKGRKLVAPKGQTTRPVPDRLKESLFSILQPWLEQARVLDLCSGTGAMGIEALSRGAAWATFVDTWEMAIQTLRQNLRACGVDSGYEIIHRDGMVALRRLAQAEERFDLIFFDPPYASDLYEPVLEELGRGRILHSNALVMVMHHAKNPLRAEYGKLRSWRELKQGENILGFYVMD